MLSMSQSEIVLKPRLKIRMRLRRISMLRRRSSVDVTVSDLLEKAAKEDEAAEVSGKSKKDVVEGPLVSDCMKIKTGDKDEAVEEVGKRVDAKFSKLLKCKRQSAKKKVGLF